MSDLEPWMGFIVPSRDNNTVRHRRVNQGDAAIKKLEGFCDRKRVAVQAGGNWGYWPLRLSGLFDTVYTFEPDAVCFSALAINTAKKHNVVRFQACLGDDRALVDLWRDVDTTGNQRVEGRGIYPTFRIDDLGLEVCDLIYLDIEGCEAKALKGAKDTIQRCKPIIAYEERQAFEENTAEARKFLSNYRKIGAIGADLVLGPA